MCIYFNFFSGFWQFFQGDIQFGFHLCVGSADTSKNWVTLTLPSEAKLSNRTSAALKTHLVSQGAAGGVMELADRDTYTFRLDGFCWGQDQDWVCGSPRSSCWTAAWGRGGFRWPLVADGDGGEPGTVTNRSVGPCAETSSREDEILLTNDGQINPSIDIIDNKSVLVLDLY